MARTSKRKVRLESQSLQENVSVKTYMAGIYARLSVDNHDGKEISIETQIEMAKEYLNMGFYLGIGGVVTFQKAKKLKEVVDEQ